MAPNDLMSNGLSQLQDGSTPPGAWPVQTFASATTENRTRITISAPSRNHCVRAETSMPT